MQVSSYILQRLPVVTQSGTFLGKIKYFDIDTDTGHILRYFIKPIFQATGVLVHHTQIIEITEERIIVSDAAVKERLSIAQVKRKFKLNKADPVIPKTK